MNITDDVRDVLARSTTDGTRLILPEQLGTSLYTRTDKALRALGGRWNRTQRAHVFAGDAAAAIAGLLDGGEVVTEQERYGWFATPAPVVARLLLLADLSPGLDVLEPSAGEGAIARPVAETYECHVDCVEISPPRATVIRAEGYARSVVTGDFLAIPPEPNWDRVIMNPPFARGSDVRHVLHAIGFLRDGGRLAAVMTAAVQSRADRHTTVLRDWIRTRHGTVMALPDDAFRAAGTGVRTVIVTIPGKPRFHDGRLF